MPTCKFITAPSFTQNYHKESNFKKRERRIFEKLEVEERAGGTSRQTGLLSEVDDNHNRDLSVRTLSEIRYIDEPGNAEGPFESDVGVVEEMAHKNGPDDSTK